MIAEMADARPMDSVARTEDETMKKWTDAGRFLSEFLALGTLFASAYVSMMLI